MKKLLTMLTALPLQLMSALLALVIMALALPTVGYCSLNIADYVNIQGGTADSILLVRLDYTQDTLPPVVLEDADTVYSNIKYNGLGQVISYDVTIMYPLATLYARGTFFNIAYNTLGQETGRQYTWSYPGNGTSVTGSTSGRTYNGLGQPMSSSFQDSFSPSGNRYSGTFTTLVWNPWEQLSYCRLDVTVHIGSDAGSGTIVYVAPTVSGTVTDQNGQPVQGVKLKGLPNCSTGSGGTYTASVQYDWSGTVTPSKDGWVFTPVSRSYASVKSDYGNQSYIGSSPKPSIEYFTPTSGCVGTLVTITGARFTGASSVKFNGVPAIFKVDTDTTISTSVPAGATSGPISVTTPGGTGYSASSFTVIPPPTFTSFSPTSGCAGTPVIITGASFTGATSVKFNGVPAIFKVDTDTTIKTTVPNGATNGPISVTTPGGTGESTTFRVTHLVFTTQPGGAPAWSLLSPQPTVSIVDSANGVVTDFTGAVTVAIKPGTGTPGAELIGQTTVNAVAGVATFTDLRISKPGTGYVLTATADKVPAVDSHGFNVSPYASVIYRVNKNAAGPVHDGKSWSTAFQTVQAGVDAAARGDEVWVAASTPSATAYMETIRFKDGVGLYGGFAGTETDRSQRSWRTNVTVLGGAVTMQSTKAVLDGFTVSTGGTGVVMASGAATITNCIFRGNTYSILLPTGASGRLANVTNCTLSGNQYGVYMDDGSVNVVNCTISGNSASGLYAYSGTMTATNCIVAHNVWGVNNNGPAIADFSHNNVFGNAIDYLDFPDPTGSNGNIKQDPMLSDRFRDVHIQPGSPCIDAGDDSVLQADWYDIDGQSRKLGVRVDIGSDESDGTSWPVIPSRTWYVATTGNDVGEGLSWATAKRTVGAALAVAWNTDEVWVAQGTYLENVTIPMGVSVFGGFAGTETSRTQRDWGANVTRLDGNGNASSDVVRVPFLKGVLDGFTVCNGRYGLNVVGEVEIANCNLISNLHSGVYLRSRCTSMISDCSITGNAENGVQVDWNASNASIHRCDINENRIGVLTSLGAADISNCILSRNRHSGVYAFRGNVTVTNCTATDNAQSGMHAYYGTITVRNCITAFNIWGISQDASAQGTAILSHNSSFGNFSSNYMNFPDSTGTNGNISVDPLFVDRSNNDYRLMMNSPCIDAGDDSVVPPGATDLDGNPRIMGLHVDMGAYEFGSISYSLLDAATVLRIVGGLQNAASSDFEHLNVDSSSPRLDILDAARIARKVAGLEPNP